MKKLRDCGSNIVTVQYNFYSLVGFTSITTSLVPLGVSGALEMLHVEI